MEINLLSFGGGGGVGRNQIEAILETVSALPGVCSDFSGGSFLAYTDPCLCSSIWFARVHQRRLPFIRQFSALLSSLQFSLSAGLVPAGKPSSPASDAGTPTSAGARPSWLVAYSFQKATLGPQRTWQDLPPPPPPPCPVCGQARLVRGLLRPRLKRRLTTRLSPGCTAIF